MTVERLKIDINGTFRVGAPGNDATTAEFDNLLFDINQPPLRLAQNGVFMLNCIPDGSYQSGVNLVEGGAITVSPAAPSGSTAIFLTANRCPYVVAVGATPTPMGFPGEVRTPAMNYSTIGGLDGIGAGSAGYKGAGGAICSNTFIGFTATPNAFDNSISLNRFNFVYINYAIFRNFT
jgi:hypothetical protein